MNTIELIDTMQGVLSQQLERAREIRALPAERLLHRPSPEQWNVVEVFEHMVLSSSIYEKGLQQVFDRKADQFTFNPVFKPGLLGAYSVKSMLPRLDGSIPMRMRTLGRFEPRKLQGASTASIDSFIRMCEGWRSLLDRARTTDLNAMKVTSSLGPIIRFKAGDAFRFPIAHQVRHFLQIERLLAAT